MEQENLPGNNSRDIDTMGLCAAPVMMHNNNDSFCSESDMGVSPPSAGMVAPDVIMDSSDQPSVTQPSYGPIRHNSRHIIQAMDRHENDRAAQQ